MRLTLSPNLTWPLFIAGLLLLSVGMGVSAVFAARSDGGAQTVPEYYAQALHYGETLQADARNAAAGWSVAVETGDAVGGLRTVTFTLRDAHGEPVEGAVGEVEIHRPSKTERVARVPFHAAEGRYAVRLPSMMPGLWDVTVLARRDAVTFTTTQRVEVL